eukprot:5853988-Pyramimonas_sp.AAC.1
MDVGEKKSVEEERGMAEGAATTQKLRGRHARNLMYKLQRESRCNGPRKESSRKAAAAQQIYLLGRHKRDQCAICQKRRQQVRAPHLTF